MRLRILPVLVSLTTLLIASCAPSGQRLSGDSAFQNDYKKVGVNVKQRFSTVVSQDDYDWNNGYMMGFRTTPITKPAAKRIAKYAYPQWVQARINNGMDKQSAQACTVVIIDTGGNWLYP